jgi:hypothetical protein
MGGYTIHCDTTSGISVKMSLPNECVEQVIQRQGSTLVFGKYVAQISVGLSHILTGFSRFSSIHPGEIRDSIVKQDTTKSLPIHDS